MSRAVKAELPSTVVRVPSKGAIRQSGVGRWGTLSDLFSPLRGFGNHGRAHSSHLLRLKLMVSIRSKDGCHQGFHVIAAGVPDGV